MLTDDLLTYLFDGEPHLLFQPMEMWLASSRRFTSFVTTYQDKIRKKLRTTQDPKGLLDLQLELNTAYLLHQEKSLSVVYEPELAKRIRSPDFAVNFTTSLTFMLEVTRVQADPKETLIARMADTISDKLGQLLSQRSNVLLVGVESVDLTADDLRAAMLGMQQRAERNDLTFLQQNGYRDRAEFFRQYQLLSEVLVRGAHFEETKSLVAWTNPQAKYPLPSKVRTALYRSHTS
jgi:hypothetical protein